MVSLACLAVISMATGLSHARLTPLQAGSDECCPCPVSGSPGTPGASSPMTVTVTQPGPSPAPVTVTVTAQPQASKETVTVTAPGTTVYVTGSGGDAPSPQNTGLPPPSENNNIDQKPTVVTKTVQAGDDNSNQGPKTVTVTQSLNFEQTPKETDKSSPSNAHGDGQGNSKPDQGQSVQTVTVTKGQGPGLAQQKAVDLPVQTVTVTQGGYVNATPTNSPPPFQLDEEHGAKAEPPSSPLTVTVTHLGGGADENTANPTFSPSSITVTAAPNAPSIPPYIEHPDHYQTVTQTIHNGDDIDVEINMINIFTGNTFCIIQNTGLPCPNHGDNDSDDKGNKAAAADAQKQGPQIADQASPSASTTSCPPVQNTTSIVTAFNTVTVPAQGRWAANGTATITPSQPTAFVPTLKARRPRSPMSMLW